MSNAGKILKYMDKQGVEREFCSTVRDEHVLVADGSRTLKEELASIRKRLSSSTASATYALRQVETPFRWERGMWEDDLIVELSTQEAKISDVKMTLSPCTQSYEATNLFYGKQFFNQELSECGLPNGWELYRVESPIDEDNRLGRVSIQDGKLLIDANHVVDIDHEIGVSIPIAEMIKKDRQYVVVVKTGASQPTTTLTRLQHRGRVEGSECLFVGGTNLTPKRETVFYFDPFSKWSNQQPIQSLELKTFHLDLFIKGSGCVLIEDIALYELPSGFYGVPDFGLFTCHAETVSWDVLLKMPAGVQFHTTSRVNDHFETRVIFTEPINPKASVADVVNISEKRLYRFVDENNEVMATPVIYPIQVEGDPIEKHWGECQVSSLIYEEELRCQSWTPIRYELKSTENDWDEVSQTEFYQATERQKRTLCSEKSKLNFTLEYEYEAASQATRIESTYLQIHKQQLLVEKFSVICEETVEQTSEQVNRLEKVILDANLDRVTDVQKWIEQTDTQLNQPIEESDIDDILQMVKGVV